MNNNAGPLISLVIARIAVTIGGARGRGAAYGAAAGAMFMALWGLRGIRPHRALAWAALAMTAACTTPVAPTSTGGTRIENLRDSITFSLTDACRGGEISLQFHDRTRAFVWPSSTTHYTLNRETRTFKLACDEGAQVCFGGWLTNNPRTIWGVGQGSEGCQGCCRSCGTSFDPIDLTC